MQGENDYFMDLVKQIDGIELLKPIKTVLKDRQVDILIALSDNKGHAAYELAKAIDTQESYLSTLLTELSSYEFGGSADSYSIRPLHLKDPMSLLHKLQDQRDPLSKYIFKKMLPPFKENPPGSSLETIGYYLSLGLDGFLSDVNLYSRERFAGVKLSEDAKKLLNLKEKLNGGDIRFLNRILIEDAYPNEICKTRISLIHQVKRVDSNNIKHLIFINLDLRTFYIIVNHLVYEIRLDKSRLFESDMRVFKKLNEFEGFFIERSELKKEIKEDAYRKRYNKNMGILFSFMTSSYVGELIKKYGLNVIFKAVLPLDRFDYQKFLEIFAKKGYISLEEINDLKKAFSEKF
jgi:hypothetical protein